MYLAKIERSSKVSNPAQVTAYESTVKINGQVPGLNFQFKAHIQANILQSFFLTHYLLFLILRQ